MAKGARGNAASAPLFRLAFDFVALTELVWEAALEDGQVYRNEAVDITSSVKSDLLQIALNGAGYKTARVTRLINHQNITTTSLKHQDCASQFQYIHVVTETQWKQGAAQSFGQTEIEIQLIGGKPFMKFTARFISQLLLLITFAVLSTSSVLAQAILDSAPISDQKAGSVLIFNYYGSNPANRNAEDTKINITNTHAQRGGTMAIFFIDSLSGAVMDAHVCLAANQSVSFLTSDVDPGAKGYIVAVSVDAATGVPNYFNYFTGSESIKMETGYLGSLNAEAISALVSSPTAPAPGEVASATVATLKFDGVRYNRVPGMLVLDHIPSFTDGNRTLVIVNQLGGSLVGNNKPDNLTTLQGVVYDIGTMAYFWQMGNINNFQLRRVIANDFPQTTPSMNTVIPSGHHGWMKFAPIGGYKSVTGAVLYLNQNTSSAVSRFNGSRNLHHMSLTTDELTIPVYPKNC